MLKAQAPHTVDTNSLLATRQRLSFKVMCMGLFLSVGVFLPSSIVSDRIGLSVLYYCPLFALVGYCYALFILPFKYQLWEDSSVIFEHFPWRKTITIHLKRPFDSNLKQVVRDIPQLVAKLSEHNFHHFTFSSPIFVKNNGELRSTPLKLLEAQFAKHGFIMITTSSKIPSFTKWVFNSEYKTFYRTNSVPVDIQNKQWVTATITTGSTTDKLTSWRTS